LSLLTCCCFFFWSPSIPALRVVHVPNLFFPSFPPGRNESLSAFSGGDFPVSLPGETNGTHVSFWKRISPGPFPTVYPALNCLDLHFRLFFPTNPRFLSCLRFDFFFFFVSARPVLFCGVFFLPGTGTELSCIGRPLCLRLRLGILCFTPASFLLVFVGPTARSRLNYVDGVAPPA